jgi:hypothetical protein
MKKVIMALFLTMFLSACGNAGVQQIDLDTLDSFLGGKEDGFLFVVYENDEEFMPYVEDAAEETKAEVNYYSFHQPDGKDGEKVDDPVFEGKVENDLKKRHLYYLENGQTSDPIDLTAYDEGAELSSRIQDFIKIHQK